MMKVFSELLIGSIVFCLLFVFVVVPVFLFNAYIFQHLWLWFVSSQFEIASLTLWQSFGILILIGFVLGDTAKKSDVNKNENKKYLTIFEMIILSPLISFVLGWLVHTYLL